MRATGVSLQSAANPFPGLAPFGEQDAQRFFGRDREIDEVLDRLRSKRLLAVIGVSGCGKSSLVRAGLIPALRLGVAPGLPKRWRICTITPGRAPLASLSAALGCPADWPKNTFDLVDYARNQLRPGGSLLLVVDQFEELFRFRAESLPLDGGNAASLFANLLLNAVDQREFPIYVLLTMRTDYLGECAQLRGLPEALNDCYYLVPRMTRLQQQDAIERPLEETGAAIQPALTQRLLNDSAEDPDHLPVLQHLLRRLWEYKSLRGGADPIALEDYHAVGGWARALEFDAEAVLQGFPGEEGNIRRLFQWITDRGTGDKASRRPRPFDECGKVAGLDPYRLDDIVGSFQERGIFQATDRSAGSLVDLSHESVTWQWPRLKHWILEESERAAQLRFLLHAARQRMVLTGLALESGLQWRAEWRERRLVAQRYFEPGDLELMNDWVRQGEELDRRQRNFAEARELSAWTALSLNDDPERSLILGLYSWGKQRSMVTGLEEFLHLALHRSPSRLSLPHSASVWCVAWSPDGSRLAATSSGDVRIWDAGTGAELMAIDCRSSAVFAVTWSPDGSRVATAGHDGTAAIWDVATARELRAIRGHDYAVLSVAWSPDGGRLATASDDNTVKIWQPDTGFELRSFPRLAGAVWEVAWSPDGNRLAAACADGSVRIWDGNDGRQLAHLKGHTDSVRGIAWSPDGTRLASASFDHTARIWDTATGRESAVLRGHQGSVLDVAWSCDGAYLASASAENVVKIWDAGDWREWQTIRGYQYPVLSVSWSPVQRRLAAAGDDGNVRVLEMGGACELTAFRGHAGQVWCAAWSPDGARLASGSDGPVVHVWDANTGRELAALDTLATHVESVCWSPDGTRLAAGSDASVAVWDSNTARQVMVLRGHSDYVGSVSWSPGGGHLATGSRDGEAKIWETASGRELVSLSGHRSEVRCVAWSADGTRIATAGEDQTARVWDPMTGRELVALAGLKYPVTSVAWSPAGHLLATAGDDWTVQIWDAATGANVLTLRGHQAPVLDVAWSPDGQRLASASHDSTTRVWDARTGQELLTLRGHAMVACSVAWSPDGRMLACAGADSAADGCVQIYVIDETWLLRLVKSRITRSLTPLECWRYLNTTACPPLPDVP